MKTRGLLLIFLLVASGCKCEGPGVRKALDKFMSFAQGEDQTKELAERPRVYKVRSRKEEAHLSRSRVTAHVEVDPGIDLPALKEALRDACHDESIARGASVLKVVAWPGKLQRLVNPLGAAIFARDGKGWEGTGVGFEEIDIFMPARSIPPLSEKEYLRVMTVDSMLGRGKTIDEAVQATASYHDASIDDMSDAIRKAQVLFGKPAN